MSDRGAPSWWVGAAVLTMLLAGAGLAQAADSTLSAIADANWTDPGWVQTGTATGVPYANGAGEIARLGNSLVDSNRVYYLDTNVTVGQLYLNHFTWGSTTDLMPLTGPETLTFNNSGATSLLYMDQVWAPPSTRTVGVNLSLANDLRILGQGYSTATLSGNISGAGGLIVEAQYGGVIALGGANSFDGNIQLLNGTLVLANPATGNKDVWLTGKASDTRTLQLHTDLFTAYGLRIHVNQSASLDVNHYLDTFAVGGQIVIDSLSLADKTSLAVSGGSSYSLQVSGAVTVTGSAALRQMTSGSPLFLPGPLVGGVSTELVLDVQGDRIVFNTAEANQFLGTIRIQGAGGTARVILDGAATWGAAKEISLETNGILELNNNTTNLHNRIGDGNILSFRGGMLVLNAEGSADGGDSNEYLGVLRLASGASTVSVENNYTARKSAILQFSQMERAAGATLCVNGFLAANGGQSHSWYSTAGWVNDSSISYVDSNFPSRGLGNWLQVTVNEAPEMINGIIPGVFVRRGVWGDTMCLTSWDPVTKRIVAAMDWLSPDPHVGNHDVVGGGNCYGSIPNYDANYWIGEAPDSNQWTEKLNYLSGSYFGVQTLQHDTGINSLSLTDGGQGSLLLNGYTLKVTSGMFNVCDGPLTIAGGNLTSGYKELVLYGDLNGSGDRIRVDANIVDSDHPVTLVATADEYIGLYGHNTYSGGTYLNAGPAGDGMRIVDANNAQALGTGPVTFQGGSLVLGNYQPMAMGNDVVAAGPAPTAFNYQGLAANGLTTWNTDPNLVDANFAVSFGKLTVKAGCGLGFYGGGYPGNSIMGVKFNGLTTLEGGEATLCLSLNTHVTLAGPITGSGTLIVTTDGYSGNDLTLSGSGSNWTGGVIVKAGTLIAGGTKGLGVGPVTVLSGSTLRFSVDGNNNAAQSIANDGTLSVTGTAFEYMTGAVTGVDGAITGATTVAAGASLNVSKIKQASVTVNGTLRIRGDSRSTSEMNTLAIAGATDAWTGTLDIKGNYVVVHGGNMATVTNQLKSGFDSGWAGPGITSSTAAKDTTFLTGVGMADAGYLGLTEFGDANNLVSGDLLIRYTWYGDADLSGAVDYDTDYNLWAGGFFNGYTGWQNGDFNHDGVVDYDTDYNLWAGSFFNQTVLPTAFGAIPEPGTLALLVLGAAALLRRRNAEK